MNIVQMLSRDVTDKQQRILFSLALKCQRSPQCVKTPPPPPPNHQYADSTEPETREYIQCITV